MGRETAPLMGLMCSDCSEGESSFFTREGRKTGGTNGCWGGHAGVLLGFMHLPSEAASCSSHHKAKATAAKVAARQSGGQANPVCQPPFLPLHYVRGPRLRLNLPSEPPMALLPACYRQESRPSAPHVPCLPGVEGVPLGLL